ncbi:hypothetical protein SARC_07986 [Sphaeroforma arctica JP610]|uniref:Uncharacterized protein n=1 Tax=Sphaeroforma arctica JP610 TaxID=667725 RepID=A0A0L0FS55_9EUKA|nr:hypothetical protein SARC_07986 [Sphaeroforma arctica JP610]KNC79622.1 hypothetical protein SARC_07986 [Sphaeroforma arctica JP610]|eukprot:XP_014153524.1 hypothetical protein SARC_07986 [Sphaeroforma arctica JP610]
MLVRGQDEEGVEGKRHYTVRPPFDRELANVQMQNKLDSQIPDSSTLLLDTSTTTTAAIRRKYKPWRPPEVIAAGKAGGMARREEKVMVKALKQNNITTYIQPTAEAVQCATSNFFLRDRKMSPRITHETEVKARA